MVGVGKCGRERVVQHCRSFLEVDTVLLSIGRGFPRIPSENHRTSIRLSPLTRYPARRGSYSGGALRCRATIGLGPQPNSTPSGLANRQGTSFPWVSSRCAGPKEAHG
jgi:hypothetical protein